MPHPDSQARRPLRSPRRRLGPLGWSLAIHAALLLALGVYIGAEAVRAAPTVITADLATPPPLEEPEPEPEIPDPLDYRRVPQDVETVEVEVPLPPPDFGRVADDAPVLRPASLRLDPLAGLIRDQVVRRPVEEHPSEEPAAVAPATQPPAAIPAAPTQGAGTSRKARPLADNAAPAYPERARRRGWTGVVLLHIHVSADGEVLEVEIAESSGYSDLDRSARRAALDWRYRPALRDGAAVATWLAQPVRFRL